MLDLDVIHDHVVMKSLWMAKGGMGRGLDVP